MKSHFNHFIKHLAHGFAFLFILILFLDLFNFIPGYWGDKTIYLFFLSLILGTVFMGLKIKDLSSYERKESKLIKTIYYSFLILIVILSVGQFFDLPLLKEFKLEILSLSVGLGILTILFNYDDLTNKFELEKKNEKEFEQEKERKFSRLSLKINRIPVLRSVLNWFYKEGWVGYALLGLIIIAFILRIWGVGRLGLTVDEHFAYAVGKNLLTEHKFLFSENIYYYRGWTYSILVALSFFFFGISEFSLRLPGVI